MKKPILLTAADAKLQTQIYLAIDHMLDNKLLGLSEDIAWFIYARKLFPIPELYRNHVDRYAWLKAKVFDMLDRLKQVDVLRFDGKNWTRDTSKPNAEGEFVW